MKKKRQPAFYPQGKWYLVLPHEEEEAASIISTGEVVPGIAPSRGRDS
jgi:hypothetical protein